MFRDLATCEVNYRGLERANSINYKLMLWEQGKWEMIYRLVFPEEAPWGRVRLTEGVTCSPYQWEKLIKRLTELLRVAGKSPAEGWGNGEDPRNGLAAALTPDTLTAEQVSIAVAANRRLPDPPGGFNMQGIADDLNKLMRP